MATKKNISSKTIASIMTTRVVTVEMDESLESIREIFNHVHFHHLLVVHRGRLMGIISDRDVLKEISPFFNTFGELPRDSNHLRKKAHQFMSRKLITINKDTTIETAVILMVRNSVSCLPIVSPKRAVQGIVTWKDLLASAVQKNLKISIQKKKKL